MAVPLKPHTFTIGGASFTGFAEPYTPEADKTPPDEALTVKAYWLLLVDEPADEIVQDAEIEDIALGATVIETGPLYVRLVKPYVSGLSTDHVEIRAVAYRGEA